MCHMDFLYSTYCKYYPDAKAYFSDPTKAAASVADFASELLDMGVYVNFDGWGDIHGSRHKLNQGFDYCWGFDDFFRLAVVAKLLEKGYAEKIMFGHDKYNKLGGFYGGAYGYTRFPTFAIPALREMGYEKEARCAPSERAGPVCLIAQPTCATWEITLHQDLSALRLTQTMQPLRSAEAFAPTFSRFSRTTAAVIIPWNLSPN